MAIRKPEIGQKRLMPLVPEIRAIDDAKRTIEFVASTESEDRHGDIIRVAGWKLDNYLKNPVFLWAHRASDPPIGKTLSVKIEANPAALVHLVEFADRATYPFADTIYRLYKGKFINATSVGFMPLETPKRRYGEDEEFLGYDFTSQELLELSGVPVPANQDALARAVNKGVLSGNDAQWLTKCGEENAPWGYCVPGVTYAAEDEPTGRSRIVVPEMPKVEEPPIVEADPLGDQPEELEGIQILDGDITIPHAEVPADFATPETASTDFPIEEPEVEEKHEDDALDFHPHDTVETVMGTKRCQKRIARAMRWMEESSGRMDYVEMMLDSIVEKLDDLTNVIDDAYLNTEILLAGDNAGTIEAKVAVPYRKEKLAERDYAWDASAEMAKQSEPAGWKRMSTVIVGDVANKTSYKLPHHRGNDYATVFRGVTAALGRFEQTQMPSEDRAPGRRHLLRHRAELETEASFDLEAVDAKMEILGNAYRPLKETGHDEAAAYFEDALQKMWPVEEAAPSPESGHAEPNLQDLLAQYIGTKIS